MLLARVPKPLFFHTAYAALQALPCSRSLSRVQVPFALARVLLVPHSLSCGPDSPHLLPQPAIGCCHRLCVPKSCHSVSSTRQNGVHTGGSCLTCAEASGAHWWGQRHRSVPRWLSKREWGPAVQPGRAWISRGQLQQGVMARAAGLVPAWIVPAFTRKRLSLHDPLPCCPAPCTCRTCCTRQAVATETAVVAAAQ